VPDRASTRKEGYFNFPGGIEDTIPTMVRIREISDPELRERIREALAERRGCSVGGIPDWYELDDHDFVDLLNDLKEKENPESELDDPRM
jgi:hypothetical protein